VTDRTLTTAEIRTLLRAILDELSPPQVHALWHLLRIATQQQQAQGEEEGEGEAGSFSYAMLSFSRKPPAKMRQLRTTFYEKSPQLLPRITPCEAAHVSIPPVRSVIVSIT
jgi:hypothetical protein